jgi:CheY-like chemotaxis protein
MYNSDIARILFIEDSRQDALNVEQCLMSCEEMIELTLAATLRDAKKCLHLKSDGLSTLPDGILMDLSFEDGNGFDFLDWKMSRPDLTGIPVIVLTEDSSLISHGVQRLGVTAVIQKPKDSAEYALIGDALAKILSATQLISHASNDNETGNLPRRSGLNEDR